MRGWRRPALAWLALAVYLLPASAFAQATKAGVVTTLEGTVTAVRAVAPQPVVLKFKDDVYLHDRVVTGEQSFARLLLGGKAVVSIRERSAVTITEVPGRSTIDIESGKIALSAARDRMQPGEVINIKTPNAVAGVRGTVVVAQVTYSLVGGAQQAASNLWVLRGVIEAVHTNAAGAAIGAPVPVGAMQSFSATPTTSSTGTFTLQQVSGIVQDLQAKGAPDPGTASQAPARLEAVNTAVALLGALTGSPAMQQLATGTSPTITTPTATTPEQKVTEVGDIISSPIVPSVPELQLQLLSPPPANMTTLQSGQNLLVFTGNQVQSSDGTPIVPTTDPLLSRTGFTIVQQGPDDLIVARPDAKVPLPGPLLKFTDTSVQAGDAFLSVAGRVTSTSPQPFIDLDSTIVTAPGHLVEAVGPNGALRLAGTLVKDTGGTVDVGWSVVSISQGGALTTTGQGPLVQLNGTTMTASSLLSVVGSSSSATLRRTPESTFVASGGLGRGGDLLRANASTVNLGGGLLEASNGAFVDIQGANGTILRLDAALLAATAPVLLLTGNGTRLQTSGNGIDVANRSGLQSRNANDALIRIDSQARMDVLSGHLVNVSASGLNVTGDLLRMGGNTTLNVGSKDFSGVLLNILNGGAVNINGALVAFSGSKAVINVTNNIVPNNIFNGVPVFLADGAVASIGRNALANVNANTININGKPLPPGVTTTTGITGSLISVGANGIVRVGGLN